MNHGTGLIGQRMGSCSCDRPDGVEPGPGAAIRPVAREFFIALAGSLSGRFAVRLESISLNY